MPESRFLKIIIVALLLLNMGTLGYLWTGRDRERPRHAPFPPGAGGAEAGRENTGEYLRRTLKLTDEQENSYRRMRHEHHETMMQMREQMRELKRRLYGLMRSSDSTATRPAARLLIDSLAAAQGRIEEITYIHFREVRMLCSPEQQAKFDEVIGDALERMR